MKVTETQSEQQLELDYAGHCTSSAAFSEVPKIHSVTPRYGLHQGVLYFHNALIFNSARINTISP